jgi:hypothetical protein
VLGEEHAVEAPGVGRGGKVQLVRIDFGRRERRRGLDPVEDAEIQRFHGCWAIHKFGPVTNIVIPDPG